MERNTRTWLSRQEWKDLLRDRGTIPADTYVVRETMWPEVRIVSDESMSFRSSHGRLWHRTRLLYRLVDHVNEAGYDESHTWFFRYPERLPVTRAQAWCGFTTSSYADDDLQLALSSQRPTASKACRFCWPPQG